MKRILFACSFLITGICSLQAEQSGLTLDSAALLPPDTAVSTGVLTNGLRYYVRANRRPEKRAELLLAVKVGSVLEQDNERGLSHFLEHMAFDGTKNFPDQSMVKYMESIGMRYGSELNAYTTYDHTVYTLTVPTDSPPQFRQGLQILEDWAHQISFEDDEIEKERGVIIEEWRLGRGARRRIWDRQSAVLLNGSRYVERKPIGDTTVIRHFPAKRLRDYYRRWYRPDLMAVIAVGDFDRDTVVRQITGQFKALPGSKKLLPRPFFPVAPQVEPRYSVVTDPEATGTTVSVDFLRPPDTVRTVGGIRRELSCQLFSAMLKQRLAELARQPQAPFIEGIAGKGGIVDAVATFSLDADVPDTGIAAGLTALLTEARRVRLHGFTATELARAKAELLRQADKKYQERDKTESQSFAWSYLSHHFSGNGYLSPADAYQLTRALLPGIGLDEINALAGELITAGNRVFLASGPQRPDLMLPSEADLRQVVERVEQQDVAPYVDKAAAQDLMPVKPKPGKVVSRKEYRGIGLTEWKLSNGARVLLKPTDFKNDEILMRAFCQGGFSLADSSGLASAQFAASIVEQGGLGVYDKIQMEKFLAGKIVSVKPTIGRFDQGLTASASPADLVTMLQMAHLYLTAPRRDSSAFQSFINRTAAGLSNRNARPETALADSLQLILGRHHYRYRPVSEEILPAVNLDKAFDFYRQRFADAGNFTFIFVGNFQPDSLKPLIETYLGSLPGSKRKTIWKDDGVRYPDGVNARAIAKGIDPKCAVQLAFPSQFTWSQRERLMVASLSDFLDIRLNEVVREDKSGTYYIWSYPSPSAEPEPQCLINIGFGCAPDRADELTAAVLGVIDTLRQSGISGENLAKIKEMDLKEWETNSKKNSYWSSVLYQYFRYNENPEKIMNYPALVKSLTAEDIRQAALKYLNPDRYVKIALFPEKKNAVGNNPDNKK